MKNEVVLLLSIKNALRTDETEAEMSKARASKDAKNNELKN